MDIRQKILDAATRIYAQTGFRGATTRRIALEAGVNEVTLFRHFGSKADLLSAAISHSQVEVEPVALPVEPADPVAELTQWAERHVVQMRGCCELMRTLFGEINEHPEMMPAAKPPPVRAARALCEYLETLQARGMASKDFDAAVAAAMLMGALFADAMGRDIMPDMYRQPPEDALREYVRLFVRAIGGTAAGTTAAAGASA